MNYYPESSPSSGKPSVTRNQNVPAPQGAPRALSLTATEGFADWLKRQNVTILVTTYEASQILALGLDTNDNLAVNQAFFPRCMGVCVTEEAIWLASAFQVWRLENVLPQTDALGYDRRFVPVTAFCTGEVFIHDIAADRHGQILFANTSFSCVSAVSIRRSFEVVWKPTFIDTLVPQDICHLNGICIHQGEFSAATICGESNSAKGWRENRVGAGVLVRPQDNSVICRGLTMPHSPRSDGKRLVLLNSGTGDIGFANERQQFEPIGFCNGFARGLSLFGKYAVVGLSKPRRIHAFDCLPLNDQIAKHGKEAMCGLQIIDMESGNVVHQVSIEDGVIELYDVNIIPNCKRASIVGSTPAELSANVWYPDIQVNKTVGWVQKHRLQ